MGRAFPNYGPRAFPIDTGRREFPNVGGGTPIVNDPFFANVKLLCHMGGVDAGVETEDDSTSVNTCLFWNDGQIDTEFSKYGGTSMLLDGTGDLLFFPDKAWMDWGDADFTIDAQMKLATGNSGSILTKWWSLTSHAQFFFNYNGDFLRFRYYYGTGSNSFINIVQSWHLNDDAWHHVSVDRKDNVITLYSDGTTHVGTDVGAGRAMKTGAKNMWMGGTNNDPGTAWFTGNIDELRVTVGNARYNGTHVAQTDAWPNQ